MLTFKTDSYKELGDSLTLGKAFRKGWIISSARAIFPCPKPIDKSYITDYRYIRLKSHVCDEEKKKNNRKPYPIMLS